MAANVSSVDKLEAFVEISNTLTKLSRAADESVNRNEPVTKDQMSTFFTDDAVWTFFGANNKPLATASMSYIVYSELIAISYKKNNIEHKYTIYKCYILIYNNTFT